MDDMAKAAKRIIIVRIAVIIITLIIVFSVLQGCVNVSVNQEKDGESVVLVVEGEEIYKKDFLRFYNAVLFINEVDGEIPLTDPAQIKEYKEQIFSVFSLYQLLKRECAANEKQPDPQAAEKETNDLFEEARHVFSGEEAFSAAVLRYADSEEELIESVKYFFELESYDEQFFSLDLDLYKEVGDEPAITVDGVSVPKSVLYYYIAYEDLISSLNGVSSQQTAKEIYESCIVSAARDQAYIAYAEANGIEIDEKEISSSFDNMSMIESYVGQGVMSEYLKNRFFVGEEQHAAAKQLRSKSLAFQRQLSEELKLTIDPTEEQLSAFYEQHIQEYTAASVSAYHILTEDKAFAEALLKESRSTPDGYMKVYEKYKNDKRVVQASDLGSFGQGDMVEDFESGVFSMAEGEIKLVQTEQYGYHLVYVYAVREITTPLNGADVIRADYIEEKLPVLMNDKLKEIYSKAKIKEYDYLSTPQESLEKMLKDKYSVKEYMKTAVR